MKLYLCLAAAFLCASTIAQGENPSTLPSTDQSQLPVASGPQTPAPGVAPVPPLLGSNQQISEVVTDYRFEDLPAAVQKTALVVSERSAYKNVGDIDRETFTGNVVWEIEYEKEGANIEIYIDENGILIPEPGLIDFRVTRPVPRGGEISASGAAPGSQSGRGFSSMGPSWGDLPAAIQQKAAQFGGEEKVADIDRETKNGLVEYEIEFRREARNLEIQFTENGAITESNDPNIAPVNAAPSIQVQSPTTSNTPVRPDVSEQP